MERCCKTLSTGKDKSFLAKENEISFLNMMDRLGVLPANLIRVSDSLPQIISYIQKIIDNGFAYLDSTKSINFDTKAYIAAGYEIKMEEVENPKNDSNNIKKDKRDFVLWKSRDIAEVGFESNFIINGENLSIHGRPGWHIECSAMINEVYCDHLHIHLGGIDLKFPHHTNERLQAHAYHHPQFNDSHPWTDKFMHVGHLCIEGLKMSEKDSSFLVRPTVLQK